MSAITTVLRIAVTDGRFCAVVTCDDPNEVTILFEWDDDEDPQAFFRSDEMRARLRDAGLKGQPEMSTLELVEQSSTIGQSA